MAPTPTRGPTPPSESAARWAAWLRAAMQRRFGQRYRNVELSRASGGKITEQTVSRWLRATLAEAPSPKLVSIAAAALQADETEALTAAGHITQAPGDRAQRLAHSAAANRFGAWLRENAETRGMNQDHFMAITEPERPFTEETLRDWWDGKHAPDPVNAALLGVILDLDPVTALRAAGHDDVADTAEALRRLQDPHVRRAERLVTDPATRSRLIAEYEERIRAQRRDAGEVLELKARYAGQRNGEDPATAP